MSIAMNSICLECHFQRNLKMARTLGTEEQTLAFAKELMKLYISAPENVSSPWFTPHTADIFDRIYDHPDLYGEAKRFSNAFVLERLDQIREKVSRFARTGKQQIVCPGTWSWHRLCENVEGNIPTFDEIAHFAQDTVRELGIYRETIPMEKEGDL